MGNTSVEVLKRITLKHRDLFGHSPPVYVETGAGKGGQLRRALASSLFSELYAVELEPVIFAALHRAYGDVPGVFLFEGDSRDWLKEYRDDKPVFFYLDAHYMDFKDGDVGAATFPLWDELDVIRGRGRQDIVVVDDVHTFGRTRPDLRRFGHERSWEGVTPKSICEALRRVKHSYKVADHFVCHLR